NARSVVEHVIVETLARSVITPHFNCLIAKGRPVYVLHGEPVAQQIRGELLGGSDGLAVAGKLAVARPAASEECERLQFVHQHGVTGIGGCHARMGLEESIERAHGRPVWRWIVMHAEYGIDVEMFAGNGGA